MGSRGALLVTADDAIHSRSPSGHAGRHHRGRRRLHRQLRPLLRRRRRASRTALVKAARYAADSITRRGTQKAYATEAEFADFRTRAKAVAG